MTYQGFECTTCSYTTSMPPRTKRCCPVCANTAGEMQLLTPMLVRKLLRANGTSETFFAPIKIDKLREMVGCNAFHAVSLWHMGEPLHVMLVDDNGLAKRLPVNVEATELYRANCKLGARGVIVGDVVIVPDEDQA